MVMNSIYSKKKKKGSSYRLLFIDHAFIYLAGVHHLCRVMEEPVENNGDLYLKCPHYVKLAI